MDCNDAKLVIRAPNQNVDDQSIDCQLDWTVEKLKNRLCEVYPNNPEPQEQKIIYSGRLLRDHLQLKDILRNEDKTSVYILHLVCSSQATTYEEDYSLRSSQNFVQTSDSEGFSDEDDDSEDDQDYSDSSQRSQSRTSSPADELASSDNLSEVQQPTQNQDAFNQMQYMSQMYMNYFTQQSNGFGAAVQPPITVTPDIASQMAAFQNMYNSYYYQYMQNLQMFSGLPASYNVPNQSQAVPPLNPPNRNEQANARRFDDDNEHANRDWLDYFYLCCRGFVLFSIVYFYSSPERLVLVIGLAFLALLYQEGWILVRLRNEREHDNGQRPQAAENRNNNTDDEASAHSQNEDTDRDRQNINEIEAIMDGDDPPHAQNHRNAPIHQSTAWTFICSFFTSLIPEPPAPVNIN